METNSDYNQNWLKILVKLYEKKLKLNTNIMQGTKKEKLARYLDVLKKAHCKVIESKDPTLEQLYKSFYHDLYVNNYKRNDIVDDQKNSLDTWIDAFLWDEDLNHYSFDLIFWVLDGVSKLGKYDKNQKRFLKRDNTTLYPFPNIDKNALLNTIKIVYNYLNNEEYPDVLKAAIGQGNFKIIYEYCLQNNNCLKSNTKGKWIHFPMGSDYKEMLKYLMGSNTGWCDEQRPVFAKKHLERGGFYIYFTEDNNKLRPRIAIRTCKDTISEIAGIDDGQCIEDDMLPILDDKLKECASKDQFYKKIHDTKLLTLISQKIKLNEKLSPSEIKFLYQTEYPIELFGFNKELRIKAVQATLDAKSLLAEAYNLNHNQVAANMEELNEDTVIYIGNLNIEEEECYFPKLKYIVGNASFERLKSARGLESLTTITGYADFSSLVSSLGLSCLKSIGDTAYFINLKDARYLSNLTTIGRIAYFNTLEDSTGLDKLENVGFYIKAEKVTNPKGLENLKKVFDKPFDIYTYLGKPRTLTKS